MTLGHFLINRTALESRGGAGYYESIFIQQIKLRSDFVGGGSEVQEEGHIYTYGLFMFMYVETNSAVKQLSN